MKIISFLTGLLAFGALLLKGTELDLKANSPWQKIGTGEFFVKYSGKGWPGLVAEISSPTTNTFYKLSWEGKAEAGVPRTFVSIDYQQAKKDTLYIPWHPATEYESCLQYFPAQMDAVAKRISFSMNPGPGGNVFIRNASLAPLLPAELEQNLLPDGDFESGNTRPSNFSRVNAPPFEGIKIVQSPAFLSGCRSLELHPKAGENFAMESIFLPVIPGRKVKMIFWAKAERPAVLRGIINFSARIHKGGKHLYASANFKLNEQWQQYSFRFDVPTDTAAYPALLDKMAKLQYNLSPAEQENRIFLDNIEFRLEE